MQEVRIRDIQIEIQFLQDIIFNESPNTAIYKSICSFIKRIVCLNTSRDCFSCSKKNKCIYSLLTGCDFVEFSDIPFIVSCDLLNKREFKSNEKHKFYLTLLGNSAEFTDFVIFALKEFEYHGLFKERYLFKIISLDISNRLNEGKSIIEGISILTPIIYKKDVLADQYERIQYLNEKFDIINHMESYVKQSYDIKMNYVFLSRNKFGNKIFVDNGFLVEIKFHEGICFDNAINLSQVIGFGNHNFFNGRNVYLNLRGE